MVKRTVSDIAADELGAQKRARTAPPAFSPIKVATKANADLADANTPFKRLVSAMEDTVEMPLKGACVAFWMRLSDLRIKDNRGLAMASEQARQQGIHLIVLFVISPQDYAAHDRGKRKIDFTLRNVASVKKSLDELHIPLHVITAPRRRSVVPDLLAFLDNLGCNEIYGNIEYEVDELRRDAELCTLAKEAQKRVTLLHNKCIIEPGVIMSKTGKSYAVYSPYSKQWIQVLNQDIPGYLGEMSSPSSNEDSIRKCAKLGPLFDSLVPLYVDGFQLDSVDAATMKELWPEGEDKAAEVLQRFLLTKARTSQMEAKGPLSHGAVEDAKGSRISKYHTDRDRADKDTTSRLSPYLSSGVISVREVLRAVVQQSGFKNVTTDPKTGIGRFVQEIAWRDFYTDVLASFPRVAMGRPCLEKYSEVVWENHQAPNNANLDSTQASSDSEALAKWKAGRTGVPIVDAAMRCLNQIGWMHNRMRMIVAMYLTKHLMIDWRVGERYFMEQLIDGDLASNNGGWQWSASTGIDPCPYFRIFNPHSQSTKADPGGDFIRHWVPELVKVRGPELHDPPSSLARKLNYPLPIIVHKVARERALRRYKNPGEV